MRTLLMLEVGLVLPRPEVTLLGFERDLLLLILEVGFLEPLH